MSEVLHRSPDGTSEIVRRDDGSVVAFGLSTGPDGATVRIGVQLEPAPRKVPTLAELRQRQLDAEAEASPMRNTAARRFVEASGRPSPPWEAKPKPEGGYDFAAEDRQRSAALSAAGDARPVPPAPPKDPTIEDPGVRDFLQGQAARAAEDAVEAWLSGRVRT